MRTRRRMVGIACASMVFLLGAGCPAETVLATDDDDMADDDDNTSTVDADGDGWDEAVDCNDNNAAINPEATDIVGDDIDQNCDGVDGFDGDGDGYAADWSGGDDCDDNNPDEHPGAAEVCDGEDNDCDGSIPDDEADADGDGFRLCNGDCDDADVALNLDDLDGDGYSTCDDDCDDDDPNLQLDDVDSDGFTTCDGDCDDEDEDVFPGATVVCDDGIDNDCDGTTETCGSDSLVQAGNHESDILFVVDNSSHSMIGEQEQLANNFEDMHDQLTLAGVDFHIAVATTDTGEFHGDQFIDSTTPDLSTTFASMVNVGESGSGTERGYQYGCQALDLAASGLAPNDGFLRERAGLRLIFASDEDDQSLGTVTGYISWAQDFLVNPAHLQFNGFTGQLAGCTGSMGSAYAAPRYDEGITATGGLSFSICDDDWSISMADLGTAADHLADTFPLTHTPLVGTIQVSVNGAPVTSGWSHDQILNAILFDAASVPSNGDDVSISYAY